MARKMSAARAVIRCMEIEDVKKVFCVPGESYLPVLDALYDHETIELISARHEGGASFMAEGYAKASGEPGVVMATRGVGASNLSIGVHTAMQDSTPMVVFLGQVHSRYRGREGFQEVDLDRFFTPIAKWAVEISHPDRIPELVQKAFRTAKSGRPGPVIVSLPEDVLKEAINPSFAGATVPSSPLPSENEIHQITQMMETAKQPVILAGGGIKAAGAEEALIRLSESMCLPVLASFRRHDVFPNDHPHYAGHVGLGTNPKILSNVQDADVILAIGTRLSEVTTQDYTLFHKDQRLIHIDIDANVLGKSYAPSLGIVADANQAINYLIQRSGGLQETLNWHEWTRESRQRYIQASALNNKRYEEAPNVCDMKNIIQIMQEVLPQNTIFTNDAGNFAGWMHAFYQFHDPRTYVGPTSGAMGYGLPAALGVRAAQGDRLVVSLSGDGGFMMTMQEMETATRHQLPVIALVFNNNMYGTIRMHQEKHFPERVVGTTLGSVNFSGLADTLNWKSTKVDNSNAFEAALRDAVHEPNIPTLIEVMIDSERISVKSTITEIRANK